MSDETTASFPATATATGDVAVPGYALGEEIGRGGMGVVYRARDVALDREVAVKLLQDRYAPGSPAARRFLDEARITGQLQHPGIPPIHQAGTLPDGRPFLVMKLIKGRTLDRVLEDPATTNVLAVFEAVCQAVAYAHARGVIHRDLKPANVMVGAYGEVQVMDWGLAKVLADTAGADETAEATRAVTEIRDPGGSDSGRTQAGSILGTPAFMPPEQAIGAIDQVDPRSDVFGLGAILAVILTGQPPFVAPTAEGGPATGGAGDVRRVPRPDRRVRCGAGTGRAVQALPGGGAGRPAGRRRRGRANGRGPAGRRRRARPPGGIRPGEG